MSGRRSRQAGPDHFMGHLSEGPYIRAAQAPTPMAPADGSVDVPSVDSCNIACFFGVYRRRALRFTFLHRRSCRVEGGRID